MRWSVRVVNILAAICVVMVVLLIAWFLVLMYFNSYSTAQAVAQIRHTLAFWRDAIASIW